MKTIAAEANVRPQHDPLTINCLIAVLGDTNLN